MAVLARADAATLETASAGLLPAYSVVRGPEAGLVMLRGRAGGTGAAFNLGEASVVRCTVQSESGHVGHAYCLGGDLRRAELAAAIDAGLQDAARREVLQERVIAPLAEAQERARSIETRRAAATQVQFFTMATMRT
ncbi:MAG: phosphonate C-P lyase system protein PhnG [Pseudomonadota bacterium]|nr:phosphonate C-P lyase system protein PhnG [Pseudomonadota bacterium]